jgi:hypothetical protein
MGYKAGVHPRQRFWAFTTLLAALIATACREPSPGSAGAPVTSAPLAVTSPTSTAAAAAITTTAPAARAAAACRGDHRRGARPSGPRRGIAAHGRRLGVAPLELRSGVHRLAGTPLLSRAHWPALALALMTAGVARARHNLRGCPRPFGEGASGLLPGTLRTGSGWRDASGPAGYSTPPISAV